MSLLFRLSDFRDELIAIKALAEPFLDPTAPAVFARLRYGLDRLSEGGPVRWAIEEDTPLRTILTDGWHEPDGKGVKGLYGEVTCLWELVPDGPAKKGRPKTTFAINGIASTVVEIRDGNADRNADHPPLAMWRMEVATPGGPGAYYHVQIGKRGWEGQPFPHDLPIPRFPCYLLTPQGALEFVLGELFQTRWREALGRKPAERGLWAKIQRARMETTLSAQLEAIIRHDLGTPLVTLKAWEPAPDLYVR